MLNGLHYFEKPFDLRGKNGGERKAPYHWHKADKKGIAKGFIQLCQALMPVLEAEQRCLRLGAPTVVLGDIHGKYDDLMQFEARLWPLGLGLCSSRILLLGDFVDRGPHGFEVIANVLFLLSMNKFRFETSFKPALLTFSSLIELIFIDVSYEKDLCE